MTISKKFGPILVAASLILGLATHSDAKPKSSTQPEKIDTAEAEELVNKLSHQPELLCLRYLHYFFGNPENNPANRFNSTKHYIWYRPARRGVKYELVQEEAVPGQITESTLVYHTDDLDLDLQKVESKFGKSSRKYFDQTTAPTEEYSFAPNTVISFTQQQNTFRVGRIQINYKGDPLPPPSLEDITRAQLQRKGLALDHVSHGRYREGISVLSEHLGERPDDIEAHLALAQAFKANCQINEAIAQYRYTLSISGDNANVRDQCVKDLQAMKVLPSVAADTELQKHNVNLKHKGQQLRRGGLASSKKMPPTSLGNDNLNVQPLDPKAANRPIIGEPPTAPSFKPSSTDLAPSPSLSPSIAPTLSPSLPPISPVPSATPGMTPEPF